MKALVPYLIIVLLSYATGIFYVLSMIEKPIWGHLNTSDRLFKDEPLMRKIHSELKRLITLLPPTMVVSMLGSALLITYQYAIVKNTQALLLLIVFVSALVYLVAHLKSRIDGVAKINSEAEYKKLNRGVIRLAQLHHIGLLSVVFCLLIQLYLVF